jgi:flavin-dependent dehydrogenase
VFGRGIDRALRSAQGRHEAFSRELMEERERFDRELEERRERFDREMQERYQEEVRITREVVRRNELAFQDGRRVMAELVEKIDAQTKAIFQVLDRLENGGDEVAT